MSLTKSIVEDAALILPAATLTLPLPAGEVKHLVPQTRGAVGHGPQFAPGEPASRDGGRDSLGEVVQSRVARTLTRPLPAGEEKREAIRRLNPAIPEEALAVIWNFRITRFDRSLR
jgi:hypothetical protein